MKSFEEIIRKYYECIDEGLLDEVFSLFSDDIVYSRADLKLKGIEELENFYLKHRKLEGNHELNDISVMGDKVIVKGVFHGVNGTQESINLGFVDYFYFNDEGLICKRETFLAIGHLNVQ